MVATSFPALRKATTTEIEKAHWVGLENPTHQISDFRLWSHALSHLETSGLLTVQLGNWIGPSHQNWLSFIDPLYHYYKKSSSKSWLKFWLIIWHSTKSTRSNTGLWYDSAQPESHPPSSALHPTTKQEDTATLGTLFKIITAPLLFLAIQGKLAWVTITIHSMFIW